MRDLFLISDSEGPEDTGFRFKGQEKKTNMINDTFHTMLTLKHTSRFPKIESMIKSGINLLSYIHLFIKFNSTLKGA